MVSCTFKFKRQGEDTFTTITVAGNGIQLPALSFKSASALSVIKQVVNLLTNEGWTRAEVEIVQPVVSVKIAQIIHGLPSNYEVDDVALFDWLDGYDTDITQIVIHDMAGKSINYWEQFDVVLIPYGYSVPSIANLLASGVPIISVEEGFADELELATGVGTFKANTRDFYVRDNTHPITSGLPSGAWIWSGSGFMWTQATDRDGNMNATVLVDNGTVGEDILIVHNTKKYAFFGWYRASQLPSEGWDMIKKTIEWTIGRSLP